MKPEIVQLKKRMIVGVPYTGVNDYKKVIQTWQELSERVEEIEYIKSNTEFYGLSEPLYSDEDQVQYLAGVEVEKVENVPEGMQAWYVSHEKYVYMIHDDSEKEIAKTYEILYEEVLPALGLYPADDYDFEVYTKEFYDGQSDKIYVFVPVEDVKKEYKVDEYAEIREMLFSDHLFEEDKKAD